MTMFLILFSLLDKCLNFEIKYVFFLAYYVNFKPGMSNVRPAGQT